LASAGFFFRSEDPGKLSDWYERHLGINKIPQSYDEESWRQQEGPTVFGAFGEDDEFLAKHGKAWILNFRVGNLDAMVKQLSDAGIEVETDPNAYPNGRFAYLNDPEGNPIQLWEADGSDA